MNTKLQNDLVSVIMPTYNAELYIEVSIKSVLEQTYSLWELYIIDDCSEDNTVNIVKKYMSQDQRIHLLKLKKNMGVAHARNEGIKSSRGKYIAFLDSDDIWLPQKLDKQICFMQDHQIGISFTQYRQFYTNQLSCGRLIDVDEWIDYENLLKGNTIGCLTVMINREYIPDIKMPSVRHEDYLTWLNILKSGVKAYGLKEDLARYRKSVNSLSGNKIRSLKWTWNVYRKYECLSFFKSLFYISHYMLKGLKKHI